MRTATALCLALLLPGLLAGDGSPTVSGDTDTAPSGDRLTVTLGVFTQEADGSFRDTGVTLALETGVPCFTWERTAPGDATNAATHQHYNAADNTSYDNDTVTWTEFGPEHSQAEIDAVCAAGQNGIVKSVNSTEYTQDKGVFLRVINVE